MSEILIEKKSAKRFARNELFVKNITTTSYFGVLEFQLSDARRQTEECNLQNSPGSEIFPTETVRGENCSQFGKHEHEFREIPMLVAFSWTFSLS